LKIKVNQKELNDALSVVSKATPSNPTIPILSGIKLEVKNNILTLYSTDLEIGIIVKLKCDADENISVVVPTQLFKNYINNLSDEDFILEIKNKEVHINNMKLNVYNADEFPESPNINNINLEINQSKLKHLLNKTNFAVSQNSDDNRIALNGLRLEIKDEKIIAVGTNTFRLSYIESNIDDDIEIEVILPYETVKLLINLLDEGKVNIIFDKNMVKFQLGIYEITSRTIAGKYPNYNQVIPDQYKTKLEVNKDDFKMAIKRTEMFDKNGIVNIGLGETLKINEVDSDVGHNLEKLETINFKGKEIETNLDAQYILDVLKKIDSETILLKGIDKLSPFNILDKVDEGFKYIVMPVRGNE
jgi:DNA polymerase-3 subunit beta